MTWSRVCYCFNNTVSPINIVTIWIAGTAEVVRVIANGEPPAVGVVLKSNPETAVLFIMLSARSFKSSILSTIFVSLLKVLSAPGVTKSPSEDSPRVRLSPVPEIAISTVSVSGLYAKVLPAPMKFRF